MALLDEKTLKDAWETSLTAMKPFWEPLDEYERIGRNKPHPKVVAAKLPTVTDGTLAGVITAQPKRIIQQLPTGRIKSVDQPDLAGIADFIWQNHILPNANYNGDVLQKSWVMAKKALTYGMQPAYAFFKNSGDYYGADFMLPYIRDVILQRGKTYGPDCEVLFMRQWYTKEQIQLIIDKEKRLQKAATERGETYQSGWNLKMLASLKDMTKEKDADSRTPAERDKSPNAPLIEIVHAFQVGVGGNFYSFSPELEDGKNVVRTKVNPDPRGKMPITFLYADIDLSNPLGVGYAEMSGGMQNLLDSEVQSYQLMQKLMLNPPVMKWGAGIKGATIKFKPNAVWDMGSDVNARIEAVNLNNEAIANFPNNYGLLKSQILNLTNNQDSSISASSGNPLQSKTPQGVAQQQQRIGFDDNYFRKQFESWFQDTAECMLNIHFAESSGEREIELTEEFLDDVAPNLPATPLATIDPEQQTAVIAYDKIKTTLKFTVDPTTSEATDDKDQVTVLQELLSEAGQNPYIYYYLKNEGYDLHLGEAYRDLFSRLGVADIGKIITKTPQDPNAPEQSGGGMGAMNPMFDKPRITINYKDVSDPNARVQLLSEAGVQADPQAIAADTQAELAAKATQAQSNQATAEVKTKQAQAPMAQPQSQATNPQLGPGDQQLAQEFLKAGYSSQQALYAIVMMHRGFNHDQIVQALGQPQGGVNG